MYTPRIVQQYIGKSSVVEYLHATWYHPGTEAINHVKKVQQQPDHHRQTWLGCTTVMTTALRCCFSRHACGTEQHLILRLSIQAKASIRHGTLGLHKNVMHH